MSSELIVIGGGLAGTEAAWQVAQRSVHVTLYEMRPARPTAAHATEKLAEIVCSNSLGSNAIGKASGLLKEELRRLGSFIMECADATAVPAGEALAVDRDRLAEQVTRRIEAHPNIRLVRSEMTHIPANPVIVASGPLTSEALTAEITRLCGSDYLYFYDAMCPIVARESIDMTIAWRASRWGRDKATRSLGDIGSKTLADSSADGIAADDDGDYINCPLSKEEYEAFIAALAR